MGVVHVEGYGCHVRSASGERDVICASDAVASCAQC